MRSIMFAVLLSVTSAWSGAAVAEVNGTYTALGTRGCGVYVKNRQADPNTHGYLVDNLAITGWIAGWITSVNYLTTGKVHFFDTDTESIFLYIDKYCRGNPLNNVHQALRELFRELNPGYKLRQ